ncbi:hypothetical protein GGD63_003384 [Bradyrhizobium sp. cir1]|nr:hypothetical protein [Bradyrhizobium sp. cir1]
MIEAMAAIRAQYYQTSTRRYRSDAAGEASVRRAERAGGSGVRALPSVRSDATPQPDATDEASMSDAALSRRKDDHLDIVPVGDGTSADGGIIA